MSILSTAQIGASGVLLIQYKLLKRGIESAAMTTDDGIDLVAYAPSLERALTIQVKTCLRPKAAGGKGRPALDWWLRKSSPAELVGLVDLASDSVWLFRHDQFVEKAQQETSAGRLHFYFYTDEAYQAQPGRHARDFEAFRIERCIDGIFTASQTRSDVVPGSLKNAL